VRLLRGLLPYEATTLSAAGLHYGATTRLLGGLPRGVEIKYSRIRGFGTVGKHRTLLASPESTDTKALSGRRSCDRSVAPSVRPSTDRVALASPTTTRAASGPAAPFLLERRQHLSTARAGIHPFARAELAMTPVVHPHPGSLKELVDCGAFRGATVVGPAQPPASLDLRPPGGELQPGNANEKRYRRACRGFNEGDRSSRWPAHACNPGAHGPCMQSLLQLGIGHTWSNGPNGSCRGT